MRGERRETRTERKNAESYLSVLVSRLSSLSTLPKSAKHATIPPMRDPRLAQLASGFGQFQRWRPAGPVGPHHRPLRGRAADHRVIPPRRPGRRPPLCSDGPRRLQEIFYKLAKDEQLAFQSPIRSFVTETIDCSIGIWADENTKALTNCDPAKIAAVAAAGRPNMNRFMERSAEGKLKWAGTQFPCSAAAQDAEMSLEEYEDFVYNAGLLNTPDPVAAWKAVSERQQRLVDYLAGKTDYHVVSPNGTDVRMSLAGKTWINCDGHVNFPDGEVFTGPVPESVNGTICFSFPAVHHGREVNDVKLTFWDGKVIHAEAGKGKEFLLSMLDMDAGSRFFG